MLETIFTYVVVLALSFTITPVLATFDLPMSFHVGMGIVYYAIGRSIFPRQ